MPIKINMYGDLLRNFVLPTSLLKVNVSAVAGKLHTAAKGWRFKQPSGYTAYSLSLSLARPGSGSSAGESSGSSSRLYTVCSYSIR